MSVHYGSELGAAVRDGCVRWRGATDARGGRQHVHVRLRGDRSEDDDASSNKLVLAASVVRVWGTWSRRWSPTTGSLA